MQQKVIPASRNKGSWLVNDNGVFFKDSVIDHSSVCGVECWTQIATEPVTVLAVLVEDGFYSIEVTFQASTGAVSLPLVHISLTARRSGIQDFQ